MIFLFFTSLVLTFSYSKIYSYCFDIVKSLRIDTHRQNIPMQNSLVKNGFRYCGIIYLESGDERIAYQKVE